MEEVCQALYNCHSLADIGVMTEGEAGVMEWLADYKASEIWACWSFVKNNDKGYEPLFNWIVEDIIEKLSNK